MATRELTLKNWPSWLDEWWLPFLWITLTPIVTVPLSAILFGELAGLHAPKELGGGDPCSGSWFCLHEYSEVVPTVIAFALPGLLNLLPFVWMLSGSPTARRAGMVAGLLGLVRFSIPLLVLSTFDRVTSPDGTAYFEYQNWSMPDPHLTIWFFGALAWLGCLLVWALFGWLSRGSALGREGV